MNKYYYIKKKNKNYFDVSKVIERYPNAWCILAVGGRSTGKTYGTLTHAIDAQKKFVFVKRTNKDVDLICTEDRGGKVEGHSTNFSPFKAINRDKLTNIKAKKIEDGIGMFWNCDENDNAVGDNVGTLFSLNAVSKFKGFEMYDSELLIFDEFIPASYERVSSHEGEQILDLYMTISRDREARGDDPLKLVGLANATSVSNPLFTILEVVDVVAEMQLRGEDERYIEDRGIVIILLPSEDDEDVDNMLAIQKAMQGTRWGDVAFGNTFANDDFTQVEKINLKKWQAHIAFMWHRHMYYVYSKDGKYYICQSRSEHVKRVYNLDRKSEQIRFNDDYIRLYLALCEGRLTCESYSIYDLILNFQKKIK